MNQLCRPAEIWSRASAGARSEAMSGLGPCRNSREVSLVEFRYLVVVHGSEADHHGKESGAERF